MNDPQARRLGLLAQVARVARLVWAERRTYLTGTIFVVVSIGTALAYPQVIRLIIDEGIIGGQAQRLNQLSLWMVVILLVEAAGHGRARLLLRSGRRARRRPVAPAGVRHAAAPGHRVLRRRDVGEITTRLSADVPPLEYVLGEEFADSLRFAVFSVLGTGLLFYTSPQLTLLTLLAVPPIVLATSVLGRRVKMFVGGRADRRTPRPVPSATEVLAGIRTVRAFSQEAAERSRYDRSAGARARVRPPEGPGAGAARRRLADRRRVRRAARHLGRRPLHRRRPDDDRRRSFRSSCTPCWSPADSAMRRGSRPNRCGRWAPRSGCSSCWKARR